MATEDITENFLNTKFEKNKNKTMITIDLDPLITNIQEYTHTHTHARTHTHTHTHTYTHIYTHRHTQTGIVQGYYIQSFHEVTEYKKDRKK